MKTYKEIEIENGDLRKEAKKLREEADRFRKIEDQKEREECCARVGHKWYRFPYIGFGDVNYLTCERCGKEKMD